MDHKILHDTILAIAKMGALPALEQLAEEIKKEEIQNIKYEGDLGKMAYELGKLQGRSEGIEIYIARLHEITNVT